MAMLETPSRIWRRIEAVEAQNDDMPSLPSLPAFDDSMSIHESDQSDSDIHEYDSGVLSTVRSMSTPTQQDRYRSSLSPQNDHTIAETRFSNSTNCNAETDGFVDRPTLQTSLSDILEESDLLEELLSDVSAEREQMGPVVLAAADAVANLRESNNSISSKPESELSFKPNLKNVSIRRPSQNKAPTLSLSASSASSDTSNTTPKSSTSVHYPPLPRSPSAPPFLTGQQDDLNENISNRLMTSDEGNEDPYDISRDSSKLQAASLTHAESDIEVPQHVPFSSDFSPSQGHTENTVSVAPYMDHIESPETPHTRRKSFLLSVINSTARPRMVLPTPHPKGRQSDALHAFAGATPGPRFARQALHSATPLAKPRRSHPLSQVQTFEPVTPATKFGSPDAHSYPSGSNTSFVSTASSHDLTMHVRANASFDPITGFQGVKFNAGKLNTYLHGLNRRLQEENEALLARLKMAQEENMQLRNKSDEGLESLREDAGAESWLQERNLLERQIDGLKAQLEARDEEKESLKVQLEQEISDRSRDKERWKSKMLEVEKGVEDIVKSLEDRLEESECKNNMLKESEETVYELRKRLERVEQDNDDLKERAEKAERAMENDQDLGGELKLAHTQLAVLRTELKEANTSVDGLRKQLLDANKKCVDSEKLIQTLSSQSGSLQKQLDDVTVRLAKSENTEERLNKELQSIQLYTKELETEAIAAIDKIENQDLQLRAFRDEVDKLTRTVEDAEKKSSRLVDEISEKDHLMGHSAEALESAEKKLINAEGELNDLRERFSRAELKKTGNLFTMETSQSDMVKSLEVDVEELETELREAQKEIGRLHGLLEQSPARKAIDAAKDARIKMLEREKSELAETVKRFDKFCTPSKLNQSGISPIHRQVLSVHMRTPKTPGGPLRDISWLNDTGANISTSPLLAEINRLQTALDDANADIDDKLTKLEFAGFGVVEYTKQLEDARSHISYLEARIVHLERLDSRRLRQLARIFCSHCHRHLDINSSYFDKSLSNEAESQVPLNDSEEVDAVRSKLQLANIQLESLHKHWDEDNASAQETQNRLRAEIEVARKQMSQALDAKEEAKEIRKDLDKSKRLIEELESQLGSERSRIRSLTIKQADLVKQKDDIIRQLKRTEEDMDAVQLQVKSLKTKNTQYETELRENLNLEQKARHLTSKVDENNDLIDRLRQERSLLADMHADLQKRFAETSEQLFVLQKNYDNSQISHDDRRHELNRLIREVEELKSAVNQRELDLKVAQEEKSRISAERSVIKKSVASLEADLRRVRQDAEVFGRDLKHLRAERDRLEAKHREEMSKNERATKENSMTIRQLREELNSQKERTRQAVKQLQTHVCQLDGEPTEQLKLRHKNECKGLIIQIRYLKAKFTRESSFRADLGYQKEYLILLLSKYEKSEMKILAAIAHVGLPSPSPSTSSRPKRRTLKTVGLLVLFVFRAQRASRVWKDQRASRQAVMDALIEVKKKRSITP